MGVGQFEQGPDFSILVGLSGAHWRKEGAAAGSTENDQKGKWPKGKWPPYDIYDFLQGKWQKEYDQK